MSASYLIFDFAEKEEAAQQAYQKLERWRQSFRLGNKIAAKLERSEPEEGKSAKKKEGIEVIVRVEFSDHEKLSRQRWLERIPADEAFKPAKVRQIAAGDKDFEEVDLRFGRLSSGIPEKRG